ncbi:MAG: CpsD/CapB family tyrosine-protein kinase [Phycisphaerales bacterium]|nr:CpsD/CapB family tyrosine-protein kinase [Phycisphaerales bacterium]
MTNVWLLALIVLTAAVPTWIVGRSALGTIGSAAIALVVGFYAIHFWLSRITNAATLLLYGAMHPRLCSASQVVRSGLRLLAVLPDTHDNTEGAFLQQEPSCEEFPQLTEQLGRIRKALEARSTAGLNSKTITICATMPGDGASTVVFQCAAALAKAGERVLIVDANFRRPRLSSAHRLDGAPGLADVLAGVSELRDVVAVLPNGVRLLPAGTPHQRIFERLYTLHDHLPAIESGVDHVLFDVPPIVVAGDAAAVAGATHVSILVIRPRTSYVGVVMRAVRDLSSGRGECLGVVLNGAGSGL